MNASNNNKVPVFVQDIYTNLFKTVYFNSISHKIKNMKTNNELIETLIIYKNLSRETAARYRTNIKQYSELNNMSMEELITEAEKEEEKGIILKKRTLKKRLLNFQKYMQEKNLEPSSISSKMAVIKAVYNFYEIQIPKTPTLKNKHYETIEDVVTRKHIIKALNNTNSSTTRAIITFMASSGTAINETTHLTINDFISATSQYHNGGNIEEILEKLEETENIVPIWKIIRQKTNYPYYTFCTPEATSNIIQLLKERQNKKKLNKTDSLFGINKGSLLKRFQRLNDKCQFGKKRNSRFFHSHNLRKFFISTMFNNELDYLTIEFMVGHKIGGVQEAYIKASPLKQREKYMRVMDNLTFLNRVKYDVLTSKEKKELEELRAYKKESMERINELEHMVELITNIKID